MVLGSDGPIAQFWLERTPDKREVDGSSPSRPTIVEIANYKSQNTNKDKIFKFCGLEM